MRAYRMDTGLDVEAVDPSRMVVTLESGDQMPIIHFIGADGEDCEAPDAVGAIADDGEDVWWIDLDEEPEVH